jgi:hypothetical protein
MNVVAGVPARHVGAWISDGTRRAGTPVATQSKRAGTPATTMRKSGAWNPDSAHELAPDGGDFETGGSVAADERDGLARIVFVACGEFADDIRVGSRNVA